MEIGRAFEAPFKDRKWPVKTAWAALWTGLVVTAPAVTGYSLDYVRAVANGHETPLPEWEGDFGRYWSRGLLVWLAGFIYFLPALVLMTIGALPFLGAAILGDARGVEGALAVGGGALCLTTMVATVYLIAVSIFFYAAQVNFAFHGEFGSMFRLGEIMARVKADSGAYFTAWGMGIVIGFITGTVSSIVTSILSATVVLAILTGFASGAVAFIGVVMSSHLLGQYAASAYALPGLPPRAVPGYAPVVTPPAPPAPPAGGSDVDAPEGPIHPA